MTVVACRSGTGAETRLVGRTASMTAIYTLIAYAAPTNVSALIVGERGTGKELVARAIHSKSARNRAPFVALHCGGLPEPSLERTLFGHGPCGEACAPRQSLFREAQGGTLFLNEVDELGPSQQLRLQRLLETEESSGFGGIDVRVLAATRRDLAEDVARGCFREDLFFRLAVATLKLPPLRERRADIPLLVHHFVALHASRMSISPPRVATEVCDALQRYDFPGNVRELSHVVERATLLARMGVIAACDLPRGVVRSEPPVRAPSSHAHAQDRDALDEEWPTLAALQHRYIERVMARTAGNKTHAAAILGMNRRSLGRLFEREQGGHAGLMRPRSHP
jgi:DNA-binding NtrC family response regulator